LQVFSYTEELGPIKLPAASVCRWLTQVPSLRAVGAVCGVAHGPRVNNSEPTIAAHRDVDYAAGPDMRLSLARTGRDPWRSPLAGGVRRQRGVGFTSTRCWAPPSVGAPMTRTRTARVRRSDRAPMVREARGGRTWGADAARRS
jgi:hypothetical protein